MPPIPKITREMIIDAAFEIARSEGVEKLNARTISQKLGCSTQPVMYNFKKIEDIKKAAYDKADEFHAAYIADIHSDKPMQEIGVLYIRFAVQEKHLFRFLFQTNEFSGKTIADLINTAELQNIFAILAQEAKVSPEQAQDIFRTLFLFAHGYASMFANNEMDYDEQTISADLDLLFNGVIAALQCERI